MTLVLINAFMGLVNIAGLVFFIIVLIKLFKAEGALKGILGIICGIYTFIWGWLNHKRLKITRWMWAWTGTMILELALIGAMAFMGLSMGLSMVDKYARTGKTPTIGTQRSVKRPVKRPMQKQTAKEPIKKVVTGAPAAPPEGEKPKEAIDFALEMRKVNTLIGLSDKNPDAFYNRGWLYEYKGDMQMAEKDYSKAIVIDNNDVDALYNRGLLFAKQKKYDEAIQDFSAVITLNPRSADALCNRGSAYFQSGKPDLSVQDYDAALQLNPKDGDLYYNRAIVYLSKGDKPKATADFKKAAELGNDLAIKYLGLPPAKKPERVP